MKKKFTYFMLLLALVFATGCNKNTTQSEPTATPEPTATLTPTPTPTPTPINLAKENLNKLPEQFDKLMSYQPATATDPADGIGYDITMKLSIGKQITSLLGLDNLNGVSITGTMDVKEHIAANLDFCINDAKVLNAHLFADAENILFNLPDYSAQYAATTWEALAASANEATGSEGLGSSLFGSKTGLIPTLNTVDTNAPLTNEAMEKLLRGYISEFTELFMEVPGITEHVSIGTGDYLFAGEKHTVRASMPEISALLEHIKTDLDAYGASELPLDDLTSGEENYLFLDYYTDGVGNYGWTCYTDTDPDDVIVYVNTAVGFYLYRLMPDGTEIPGMYSVKSSEKSGTITLVFDQEEPLGVIDYEYSDNAFYLVGMLDTIEYTMEYSKTNDTIRYNASFVVDGISMIMKETITPARTDISVSLASFGMEYLTLSMSTTTRDYVEIPVPQNVVTTEVWTEELDADALAADLDDLMQQYPILAELIGSFTEETNTPETTIPGLPEGYSDDFTGLTGYSVDEYGEVDFVPLEEEVLALGMPSTAFVSKEITEDTMKNLFNYAFNAYASADYSLDSFYNVYGNVYDDTVCSSYILQCCYYDTEYPDNSIWFLFDAVNENLAAIYVDNVSLEDAVTMANDLLAILGVDYTLTASELEDYVFFEDMYALCYEDEGYYSIYISY